MGSHRAERRAPRRAPSSTRTDKQYVGRRVAGRPEPVELVGDVEIVSTIATGAETEPVTTPETTPLAITLPAQVTAPSTVPVPIVDLPSLTESGTFTFGDLDATAEVAMPAPSVTSAGKRRAVKHAGRRGPLFKGIPSAPVLVGVAVMAVAVGGAVSSTGQELAGTGVRSVGPASAMSGTGGVATVDAMRGTGVSRATDRQALAEATDAELQDAAEAQAEVRNTALSDLAAKAQKESQRRKDDRWVLPLQPSIITATFGEYGLWSSYHTGLDFNGENGDSIYSIATGTVTFTGYDGAYGNKTVVTLDDGTELWYCHQTDIMVSEGDVVGQGEVIGTVGSTGNVTGSHLHVEVRPGGGDPVDPYPAFVVHGVTP